MEFNTRENEFDFYWKQIFNGLKWNPIEFNVYRFDESLSLPSKFNKLYEMFKQLALNNQQVMDYMKNFVESFDEKLDETTKEQINKVLEQWLINGKLKGLLEPKYEQMFLELFESIKDLLGEDLASSLALAIQNLEDGLYLTKDRIEIVSNHETLGGVRDVFAPSLQSAYEEIDINLFNFISLFDTHYDRKSSIGGEILKYSLTHIYNASSLSGKLDGLLLGGDNADVNSYFPTKKHLLNQQRQIATTLFSLTKSKFTAILKGNHDDNSLSASVWKDNGYATSLKNAITKYGSGNIITDKEFSDIYLTDGSQDENRKDNSNFFYKDFHDKKIRLIGLDTSDLPENEADKDGYIKYPRQWYTGFSNKQINWLANEALNVTNGYHVIIVGHHPINRTLIEYVAEDNPYGTDRPSINHHYVKMIIQAFHNKTYGAFDTMTEPCPVDDNVEFDTRVPIRVDYDFRETNGTLVGVFSGHVHKDLYEKVEGIHYVSTCCSMGLSTEYNRGQATFNTVNEECLDIVSVDTNIKDVKLKRVGAGNDREFNYEII